METIHPNCLCLALPNHPESFFCPDPLPPPHKPFSKIPSPKPFQPFKEATQSTFIGKVIALNGVENEDGQMEGDVVFSLLIDEESVKAKGFLKSELYRDACDAHKDSKYIKISAILREKPRVSDLDQILVLEVLQA